LDIGRLNYFSYFSEIEDTFIRRRGKHLLLSPIDWALIEAWKERGVPLHVALRGIEHSFDSHEAKKHKRTVKTLLYCQEEVEAQYAEWLDSRVGSRDGEDSVSEDQETTSFSRDAVVVYLGRSLAAVEELYEKRKGRDDELTETFLRAATLLKEIKTDYETATHPDTRKLEESLTGIERMLDDAVRRTVTETEHEAIVAEVNEQLKPYKRKMDQAALTQTRDNLVRKRLRELFDVPRLSLFYL
jgi:hypothetical protein